MAAADETRRRGLGRGLSALFGEEGDSPESAGAASDGDHVTESGTPVDTHEHAGVEAFYILEGHGTIEVEGEKHSLGPNEIILLDASKPHGLSNAGATPLRYLVIIAGH